MTEEELQKFRESAESAMVALEAWAKSFVEALVPVFSQLRDHIDQADALKREHFVRSDEEKIRKFYEHYGTGGDFWKKSLDE